MNAAIQSICYKISQLPEVKNSPLKRSQLHEVIAALLGYKSHAALVVENKSDDQSFEFADAEFIVLNVPRGKERALKIKMPDDVFNICISEVKAGLDIAVYDSVEGLYDNYLRELLAKLIYEYAEESGDMADSNASYPEYPYMYDKVETSGDLWTSINEWKLEDTGILEGEYDPEGDRMYNGHKLDVKGVLTFAKAGRSGLILLVDDCDFFVSSDDSWRDYDDYFDSEERMETVDYSYYIDEVFKTGSFALEESLGSSISESILIHLADVNGACLALLKDEFTASQLGGLAARGLMNKEVSNIMNKNSGLRISLHNYIHN
ncbi:hypothetical protein SRABI13_00470 [Erwinia aphidicola]|uniref:hypothetical protein n=1 Tax=Erwinia aphidicola TaxID=68334 RepID=UPI001DC4C19F|nr:hypothetical protein [Erwinia aphidicola]CAH0148673.1 hypothetical protein SRABI13_00470 [Erwinia aphidicola]